MSVSIINPGVGGITVETDPTALKLTGGAISGDLTVAQKVGIGGVVPVGATNKLAVHNGNIVFTAGFGLAFGDGSTMTSAPNLSGYALLTGANFSGKVSCGSSGGSAPLSIAVFAAGSPLTSANGDIWILQSNSSLNFRVGNTNHTIANLTTANTWTTKQTFTPNTGIAGINIGVGGTDSSSTTPGDMWIPTSGQTLNYRDGIGNWRQVLTTSTAASITINSNTLPALRVTQTGTNNAFVVEDSSNPDTSCFTIDSNGRLNINVDASTQQSVNDYADLWVRGRAGYAIYSFNQNGHGIYSNVTSGFGRDAIQASGGPVRMYDGMAFNADGPNISIPSVPVVATGTYDRELGITIAGVNYRFPCRTV